MDFTSQGRSNYFRVKNPVEFKEYCAIQGVTVLQRGDLLAFVCPEGLPSDTPDEVFEYEGDLLGEVEKDVLGDIAMMLADGSTLCYQEVGTEGSRYVSGWAEALDNTGKRVALNLESIYEVAVAAGMSKPTNCSY